MLNALASSGAFFSSKCRLKSIDLDKKHMFFFQMWVKKYRFGQKTQNLFGQFKKLLYLCSGFVFNVKNTSN